MNLDNVFQEFPWSSDAVAVLYLSAQEPEESGNGYFYFPTSECNLRTNMVTGPRTLGEFRRWQERCPLVQVAERYPTLTTQYSQYSHPPRCADRVCRENPDRHTRTLSLTVRDLPSAVWESIDALLDRASEFRIGRLSVAEALSLRWLITNAAFLQGDVPLVSLRIRNWTRHAIADPVSALLEGGLGQQVLWNPTETSMMLCPAGGRTGGLLCFTAHEFGPEHCAARVAGFLLHPKAYSNLESQVREVEQRYLEELSELASSHRGKIEEMQVLSRVIDNASRGLRPLTRVELSVFPGYNALLRAKVLAETETGAVQAVGDYADINTLVRYRETLRELLASRIERLLSSRPTMPANEPRAPQSRDPLQPSVIVKGAGDSNGKWAIIGESQDVPVAVDITTGRARDGREYAQTIGVFGVQGSGKTYTGCLLLESVLMPAPPLTSFDEPMAGVVISYDQYASSLPSYVSMANPNPVVEASEVLYRRYRAIPRGVDKVRVLVAKSELGSYDKPPPGVEVGEFAFSYSDLGIEEVLTMMGGDKKDPPLYMDLLAGILGEVMREGFLDLGRFTSAVQESDLDKQQKRKALQRVKMMAPYITDGPSFCDQVRRGQLLVLDLKGKNVTRTMATRLCLLALRVLQNNRNVPRLVVIDEAHKYMEGHLASEIEGIVREMRHAGISLVLSTQGPRAIPEKIIPLLSTIIVHRSGSPDWLRCLTQNCIGFSKVNAHETSSLEVGEALVWSQHSTDKAVTRVRMRPAMTDVK